MSESEDQRPVPRSFFELFVPPGRIKPTESRQVIAARYELCEDLAQTLAGQWQSGPAASQMDSADSLRRVFAGLCDAQSGVSALEAAWTVCRTAELLDQPLPQWALDQLPPASRIAAVRPASS
jgi:hypothetical protein